MYPNRNSAIGGPHVAQSQSTPRRVADVPTSPSNSMIIHTSPSPPTPNSSLRDSQSWAIPVSLPSSRLNASNTTLSSGRPSIEETLLIAPRGPDRFEQRYMYLYNAVAGGVNVQFILTYALPVSVSALAPLNNHNCLFQSGSCPSHFRRKRLDSHLYIRGHRTKLMRARVLTAECRPSKPQLPHLVRLHTSLYTHQLNV